MEYKYTSARQIQRKMQAARRREDLEQGLEILTMLHGNKETMVTPEDVEAVNRQLTKEKFINHMLVIAAKKGDYDAVTFLTNEYQADASTQYRNGKNLVYMTEIWAQNESDTVHAFRLRRIGEELLKCQTPAGKAPRDIRKKIFNAMGINS